MATAIVARVSGSRLPMRAPLPPRFRPTSWALAGLVVAALLLRVPGIARPALGNFATKAAVYGMIARNLARGEAHLLYPQIDLLVGNAPGYHLLEFPLSAYLTAGAWRVFGGSLDVWGRATSLGFSALALLALWDFCTRRHGRVVALGAVAAMTLSPVAIIYGQSFQLEASLPALSLVALAALDRWLNGSRHFAPRSIGWVGVFFVATGALLLTKIYMLYLLPVLLCMIYRSRTAVAAPQRAPRGIALGVLSAAVAIALVGYVHLLYAATATTGPTAGHVYYGLAQTLEAHGFPHPLLTSAAFYKRLIDDLAGIVLTPVGLGLALLAWRRRLALEYVAWTLSAVACIILMPRKFFEMNYYWMALLPGLCILVGLGVQQVATGIRAASLLMPARRARRHRRRSGTPCLTGGRSSGTGCLTYDHKLGCDPIRDRGGWGTTGWLVVVAGIWLAFSLRYSVVPAFVTPEEDRAVPTAAAALRRLSRPDDRVVTIHGASLDLLYHVDRRGWTLPFKAKNAPDEVRRRLEAYAADGARWLVMVGHETLAEPLNGSAPVERGPGYSIFRLP